MDILAAIKREERKLEKQLGKVQHQLDGIRTAAKALGHSTGKELKTVKKRVLSAAGKAAISMAAKKRWAEVKARSLGHSTSKEVQIVQKRVLSAAARARIGRATKKRWAAFRAKAKKVAG
jgi:hypothetical protein